MSGDAKTGSILVVDDEEDILESLKDLFEGSFPDLEVRTARSGQEGLEALAVWHPDLIISDYKMPGMNGIEFLRAAEKIAPNVPRVMITAFADPALATVASKEAGVVLLVSKPFDLEYFVGIVHAMVRAGKD